MVTLKHLPPCDLSVLDEGRIEVTILKANCIIELLRVFLIFVIRTFYEW